MTKTTYHEGCKRETYWKADVPKRVKPKVLKEYWLDGIRMYKIEGGRAYADQFDSAWNGVKMEIKKRFYKGENPSKRVFS